MSIDRSKIRWNGWGWAAHEDQLAGQRSDLDMAGRRTRHARTPGHAGAAAREHHASHASRLTVEDRARFVQILGADRVRDDQYERAFHARGRSYHDLLQLARGRSVDRAGRGALSAQRPTKFSPCFAAASERDIAVVPYGGGTSVVGGVTAPRTAHSNPSSRVDLSQHGSHDRRRSAVA